MKESGKVNGNCPANDIAPVCTQNSKTLESLLSCLLSLCIIVFVLSVYVCALNCAFPAELQIQCEPWSTECSTGEQKFMVQIV